MGKRRIGRFIRKVNQIWGWVTTVTEITHTYIRLDLPELPGWYWDPDWVIPYKQRSE